ncbi:MAG: BspA family leucine-rich repeat surface protein, partial [Clostridia bacterium]|nr:BspA family leucine-rich repeat surface protein [Clostridia bacterium]
VNFKGGEKELLKKGRGAEFFSGSNFGAQKFNNCGQNVDTSPCNAKGITLIALIITIVIMLILAGITINLTLGENGIFQKAKLAKGQYETASVQEKLELELAAMQMGRQTDLTVEEYVDGLEEKGIVLQENIFPRETETAIKIGEKIFVVYQEGTKIEVYHEEGNVMMSDTNTWTNPDTWLNTNIDRSQIKTIQFEKTNIVPDEVVGSSNIEAEGQETGAVKCWWTEEAGGVTVGEETKTAYNITIGANGGVIAPRNCTSLFRHMINLTSINFKQDGISCFNTKNTTNMSFMFWGCEELGSLQLDENFDTSKVTNMKYMFRQCKKITSLDLSNSNFDTKNVTKMEYMFANMTLLEELDLGDKFNANEVLNMAYMFHECVVLSDLDLGTGFSAKKVTDIRWMFCHCDVLTSVDLGDNFDTSSVNNMSMMFAWCANLQYIDLGEKFSTKNVTKADYMFEIISDLKMLNLGNFGIERLETINIGGIFSATSTSNCELIIKKSAKDWFYENCRSKANWRTVEEID